MFNSYIGLETRKSNEATLYYTLSDAEELIDAMGLGGFLRALYTEKKHRSLTIEELEAIQTLHDNWEL
jgi:hypothetical protein